MHMVSTVHEAGRAAESGADVLVAQGTEGGGHVGLMGTLVLVRQVVRAVAPIPVLAAGGIADGAGLAAALMLGAEGVLLGTPFLATPEAPLPDSYKQAICHSNGHDTLLTELPDVINAQVWPGAFAGPRAHSPVCCAPRSSRNGSAVRGKCASAEPSSRSESPARARRVTSATARCSSGKMQG